MGSNTPQLIVHGAYSQHFQGLQKNGIEILKQDSFFERSDVITKIRKLQHETQKRRKEQQQRREQEEKKEEDRRKLILDERRRHLQEVTEKYQRLGRKRFRLLTATASPLSRAETAFDDVLSPVSRVDGAASALPLGHGNRLDLNRGTSADTISRMQEHAFTTNSNGHNSDTSVLSEYKKASSTMLSALNPPAALQQQSHQSTSSNNNTTTAANTNTASGLSTYSAQFLAVQARHQRLLEQLGLKPTTEASSRPPQDATNNNAPKDGTNGQQNMFSVDALNAANAKTNTQQPSNTPPIVNGGQISSRPSSGVQQNGSNAEIISQRTGSVVTGLPTVVATAVTVQEAMQASYSLSSRGTSAKPVVATAVPQTLQQSVLFLQSNGIISNKVAGSATTTSHSNGSNSHQFGTIIHMHQQTQPQPQPPFQPVQPTVQPQVQVQHYNQPLLPVTSQASSQNTNNQQTTNKQQQQQQQQQQIEPTVTSVKPVATTLAQEPALPSVPKLTYVETTPVSKQQITPSAPKERPVGLVRPSSASSVKREESIALEDSLNVDAKPPLSHFPENKFQQLQGPKQFQTESLLGQLGSIKVVPTTQDDRIENMAKQIYLTSVPSVPDVLQVFNATAPDGATLMAQINEMKTANQNQGSNAISLNFKIPVGINGGVKSADEEATIQQRPNSMTSKHSMIEQSANKPQSNIPVGNRPPNGKNGSLIPAETAYTDLSGPVNKFTANVDANDMIQLSMKRYNSDSAIAEPLHSGLNSRVDSTEMGGNFGDGSTSAAQSPTKQTTIKSILKRSPSLERTLANLGSSHSHSSQGNLSNGIHMQQNALGGSKSVTFGHVHIADLTDGPISVRDSIELTKFKQGPEDIKGVKRKVMFTADAEDYDPRNAANGSNYGGGLMKSSSGSQIIRVEMGSRATPRGGSGGSTAVTGVQRPSPANGSTGYNNQAQRSGNRPQQSPSSNAEHVSTSGQPTTVDNTPSDAEINWLWEKVRSCLNRTQSAVPGAKSAQQTPNSFSTVPRISSAPLGNSAMLPNAAAQNAASTAAVSRLTQQSHKLYIDGSNISSAGAQMYVGPVNNNSLPGNATFNAAQSHQIRAPSSSGSPLKALVATGTNVNPMNSKHPQNSNGHNQPELTQSTMAFLTAEQLVAGGLSESVIHQAMDQIQHQQQPSQPPQQLQPVPPTYPPQSAGSGRSALSLEEEQIMKSLDRINDRLQYLEVTGQTAGNKASPTVNQQQTYHTAEVTSTQPTLSYMPAMFPSQQRQSSASRRFPSNQQK